MIEVINIRRMNGTIDWSAADMYIGRRRDGYSPLGNPFVVGVHGNRGECIEPYRKWLWKKIKYQDYNVMNALLWILNKSENGECTLGCFCKPHACHGDVIVRALECPEVITRLREFEVAQDEWVNSPEFF